MKPTKVLPSPEGRRFSSFYGEFLFSRTSDLSIKFLEMTPTMAAEKETVDPEPAIHQDAAKQLRKRVNAEIREAGFRRSKGLIVKQKIEISKDEIRALHAKQREQVLRENADFIARWERHVLPWFAHGNEVDPTRISPRVVPVDGDGFEAALFRYASLHWSIPVSKGYGRRTRFLVMDDQNDCLIGIFALGDPVFNLTARDDVIGWDHEQRSARLYNVMDAFVLGALPPYRELLGAKLVAMAAASNETSVEIRKKYQGSETVISKAIKHSRPVLLTSTSALGRSSIYNRLKFDGRLLYQPVGYTKGYGHFQFSNDLFRDLCDHLRDVGDLPENKYGGGPNWRIRTIRTGLTQIGLNPELLKHGIKRQVFLAPLATNWQSYLRGDSQKPRWIKQSLPEMAEFFVERWSAPRGIRDPRFLEVRRDAMRLSDQLHLLANT